MLDALLTLPQVAVPFLLSQPGLGKSSLVAQMAERLYKRYAAGADKCPGCKEKSGDPRQHVDGCAGHHTMKHCDLCRRAKQRRWVAVPHVKLIDVRLATMDPIEVKGLNFPTDDGRTEYGIPDMFPVDTEEFCILFFDEFSCAPGAVQNAALSIILDRKVHQSPLSPNCVMVAAGNRDVDGGYTVRISGPMANRLAWQSLRLDEDDFIQWGIENGLSPVILGAVRAYPQDFLKEFNKNEQAQSTPRTLEFLSRVLDQQNDPSDAQIRALAEPLIGPSAANTLMGFLAEYVHIAPADIIMKGVMPKFEKSEVSRMFAASAAIRHWIVKNMSEVIPASKDKTEIATKQQRIKNFYTFLKLLTLELQCKLFKDMNWGENQALMLQLTLADPAQFKAIMDRILHAQNPNASK